jgi:GT2 family glycosyltransferase
MAIKSKDFNDVGGFDKDFFAHMEEIDLCWRLKNLGKNIFYTSESTVYHFGGGTLKYSSPKKTYLNYRNNLWMIHKNFKGQIPLFLFILIRLLLDQISGIKLVLSGNLKGYLSIIKAHYSYLISIGKMNIKRRQFSKLNFHELNGYSRKSTIWNYFIIRRKTYSEIMNQ